MIARTVALYLIMVSLSLVTTLLACSESNLLPCRDEVGSPS